MQIMMSLYLTIICNEQMFHTSTAKIEISLEKGFVMFGVLEPAFYWIKPTLTSNKLLEIGC